MLVSLPTVDLRLQLLSWWSPSALGAFGPVAAAEVGEAAVRVFKALIFEARLPQVEILHEVSTLGRTVVTLAVKHHLI